ncbi:hypothetical protein BDV24DRAFT_139148 [Aspergillus arachidicola]|uniref:Uncharacterized protein n=1 Tax=Aspergillus arachidicola TaxID=656916 RepID=A0A5N6XZ95_9EURO|nr:hypothetical protein BDV24DRAFT_139148 [Aspergillus arachidicola]
MDCACPPPRALVRTRRTVDDELQGEAHRTVSNSHPETRQRFDLRRNLIVLFSFLLQDSPSLPISNEPLVRTITWDSSSPRRRLGSSQNSPNTSRISDPPHNNDIFSQVNEENARGNEEEDRTSSFIPTLPIPDTRGKRQMDRKMRHKTRIEALKKELEPLCTDNGSAIVLLCWGESSCCSILPVPVQYPEDEVATWTEINKAWYTRRGTWGKYLPGFGVTRVDIVEISILGPKKTSKGRRNDEYIGIYTEKDTNAERRRLQYTIDNAGPMPHCSYDRYTGTVYCTSDCNCFDCLPCFDDAEDCPVKKVRAARRDLSLLDTVALMKYVFSCPILATSNDFLEKGNLVYSHRDILSEVDSWHGWNSPGLRELKFRGIAITEGWTLDMRHVVLPLMSTIFLVVVVVAKFIFGWGTAWTVGAFFIALVTLLWMWATYMAG